MKKLQRFESPSSGGCKKGLTVMMIGAPGNAWTATVAAAAVAWMHPDACCRQPGPASNCFN
jgi:hypothetical protein